MSLVSPFGSLDLNTVLPLAGGRDKSFLYLVRPDGYEIVPGKYRAVIDSISQADGASLQEPLIDGMVATLKIEFWTVDRGSEIGDRAPACGEDVRLMNEELMGVLNSLRQWSSDPNTMQRYLWTPTGLGSDRMLNNVLLAAWPVPTHDPPIVAQTIKLGTPFPYAIAAGETTLTITAGGSATVTNNGNAPTYPVFRAKGTTSAFTITNGATALEISYDSSRPGAVTINNPDYGEILCFQGTIFLNGNGADLVAGFDPNVTDLFPFIPGAQTVSVTGADVDIFFNDAFV